MSVPLHGHQRLDRRSLALYRAIAGKLRAHPAHRDRARKPRSVESPENRRLAEDRIRCNFALRESKYPCSSVFIGGQ
jgi:hypothetical protein